MTTISIKVPPPNTTPVLFLDVDGVLNSHQWFESQAESPEVETLEDHLEGHIDPACVQRHCGYCT